MKRLWLSFVVVGSFSVLGWAKTRIYPEKPPIPVWVDSGGKIVISDGEIAAGQNVWGNHGWHGGLFHLGGTEVTARLIGLPMICNLRPCSS